MWVWSNSKACFGMACQIFVCLMSTLGAPQVGDPNLNQEPVACGGGQAVQWLSGGFVGRRDFRLAESLIVYPLVGVHVMENINLVGFGYTVGAGATFRPSGSPIFAEAEARWMQDTNFRLATASVGGGFGW